VLIDLALIIVFTKLIGGFVGRFGQPPVIGEIIGGIALGPSLLGWLWPQSQNLLFNAEVMHQLDLISQLGLILFMFLIGLELNPAHLRGKIPLASRVSIAGILLPLLLGAALARGFEIWLPELLPGENQLAGILFMGTAMAITAFPVLARILRDRQLLTKPLGQLVITCAAVDDLLGWVLLAAVVSFSRSGSPLGALPALVYTSLWAVTLLFVLRPLMARLEAHYRKARRLGPLLMALVFAGAILSAVVTEQTGVHYIFGAFLFGLAIPRYGPLIRRLRLHIEEIVLTLLLPVFFAISGLRTQMGSINGPQLFWALAAVLLVAIAGKFLGTWALARQGGLPQKEAVALGWLMNTRGLTELVILNVGLSLGVISPTLFTLMVLMALITTAMAGPLLHQLGYSNKAA